MPSTSRLSDDCPDALDTAYTLTLLSEYAYTLDTLPLELSRQLADLRELDAVLASSMTALTSKILRLTALIEQGNPSPTVNAATDSNALATCKAERLRLLLDLTDDAARLRPGSEDKIRVGCSAADSVRAAQLHLIALLEHAPGDEFAGAVAASQTSFPHVDPDAARGLTYMEYAVQERRKQAITHAIIESPHKKRRVYDEVAQYSHVRSPRKDKVAEKARNAARGGTSKKNERAPSPAESLLSVASHTLPVSSRLAAQTLARNNSNTSTSKRSRSNQNQQDHFNTVPTNDSRVLGNGHDWNASQYQTNGGGALGLRVNNTHNQNQQQASVDEVENVENDEEDHALYCTCQKPSFGGMVGCDDDQCEFQWFHFSCVGIDTAPEGKWYCQDCTAKRQKARGGRGGKRKTNARAKADR